MNYGTHMYGGIVIHPDIPDHVLAFSRFRSRESAWLAGTTLFIDTVYGRSVIAVVSDEERGERDGAVADLKDIIELLGDGYTYSDDIKGSNGDTDEEFVLSIEDGQVVDLKGETVYGLGHLGSNLDGRDIETALATLAELYRASTDTSDLSERQVEVIEKVLAHIDIDIDDDDDD